MIYVLLSQRKKLGKSLAYRFGFIPQSLIDNLAKRKQRIWIHAVSVGEIKAITSFVRNLKEKRPEADIIISTITATGKKVAEENLTEAALIIYLPFDFPWAANRIMQLIKPDIFITIETEIWPNILRAAKKTGAKTLMINGRISPRSINNYRHFKAFFKRVLAYYDLMSMIMPHDAERIISMGADQNKVVVNGNSKYDHLATLINDKAPEQIYQELNIRRENRVLIGGSTRTGEEEILLEVYSKLLESYPDLLLILVPRHIKRGIDIKKIAEKNGFQTILKTDIDQGKTRKEEKVIIINTIGELFGIYSIGSIIFCGASLVPKGGQNVMEAAAWGKAVLYGPSMDDFLDAKDLLETAGAGIEVKDKADLYQKANHLLTSPNILKKMGERARQAVFANQGSSIRNAKLVNDYLEGVKKNEY